MQAHIRKTILAGLLTFLPVISGIIYLCLASYLWAAVALVLAGLGVWNLSGTLPPFQDEKLVLKILREGGGKLLTEQFEDQLQKITELTGVYSGEKIEDLHLATERLLNKGRIRIDSGSYFVN